MMKEFEMKMKEFEMKTYTHRAAGALVVAAAGFGVPAASSAFEVTSLTPLGSAFTVNYLLASGATDPNGNKNNYTQDLSGNVIFKLIAFNTMTDVIRLQLDVSNTSDDVGNEVGLQKLAFGTDPNAIAVSFINIGGDGQTDRFLSAFLGADSEVGNAVKPLLLDIQSETGNGANKTLREGELDQFYLDITFGSIDNGVAFTPFSSKWQTNPDSFQIVGTNGGGDDDDTPMPEPATLALVGLGLLGAAVARRRRR